MSDPSLVEQLMYPKYCAELDASDSWWRQFRRRKRTNGARLSMKGFRELISRRAAEGFHTELDRLATELAGQETIETKLREAIVERMEAIE